MPTKPPPIIPDTVAKYHPPLEPAQVTRGPTGSPVRKFGAPVQIWVAELTGFTAMSEATSGGAHRAQFVTRFITRWRPDFLPNGRLVVAGRNYELTGITPAPNTARRTYLHLHALATR